MVAWSAKWIQNLLQDQATMDRWISADIVTLGSEGHELKLLEPMEPEV